MPSRNTIKQNFKDTYHHIYARGVNKQEIFIASEDYQFFISLFGRYLSPEISMNKQYEVYPNFSRSAELITYCLMDNHFHLLLYQREIDTMSKLMQAMLASYTRYFNTKYTRTGPLFESRYKASLVSDDAYFAHISRYIHMNPIEWRIYGYSSLRYYMSIKPPNWLHVHHVMNEFVSVDSYLYFLEEYVDRKNLRTELRAALEL